MKFLLAILLLFPSAQAHSRVLKQDSHQRFTFVEDYSGFYVKSYYTGRLDSVRFDICEGRPAARCSPLAELSHTKLQNLKEPMLEMLRSYRAEIEQKKNNFWHFFSRAGEKSEDVKAIDRLIAEIEEHGAGHMVLLTSENLGKEPPAMSTPGFARELAARMKAVLEAGAPMGAVDCIPHLRQQEL